MSRLLLESASTTAPGRSAALARELPPRRRPDSEPHSARRCDTAANSRERHRLACKLTLLLARGIDTRLSPGSSATTSRLWASRWCRWNKAAPLKCDADHRPALAEPAIQGHVTSARNLPHRAQPDE